MRDSSPKKILIIEDEGLISRVLELKIKQAKFPPEIFVAADGKTGLDMALREHPDFILLDLVLPNMTGLEMLGKLRDDEWGKNAAVVIMSNVKDPEKEQRAADLGVEEYLVKAEWKIEDVANIVTETLGIH